METKLSNNNTRRQAIKGDIALQAGIISAINNKQLWDTFMKQSNQDIIVCSELLEK